MSGLMAAHAAPAADTCPAPPQAAPDTALIPMDDHRLHIDSDTAALGADGGAALSGRVTVRQDQRRLDADHVIYDQKTGKITVTGAVRFEDPKLRLQSDAGSYDQSGGADFADASFQLLNRNGRGQAQEIQMLPGGQIALTKVRYTTCPAGNEDWILHASAIKLDTARGQGSARGAYLVFKGLPILYTPYFSFPLGNLRQSGFLYPSFGHSGSTGYWAGIPYYFNLAPNYDLTLTPKVLSARGVELAGEARYLNETSHSQFDGTYLPNDTETHSARSYFRLAEITDLSKRSRVDVNLAGVSDSNYFQDFAVGSDQTSVTYLAREAEYLYRDDAWKVRAQLQNFQTIDISVDPIDRPYSRVPRIDADALWPLAGTRFEFSLHAAAVNFMRDIGPTGVRVDVSPQLQWSERTAGYFFVPAVGWHYTQYDLSNAAPGDPSAPLRTVPFARLDTGLVFERESGATGQRTQTLEPRVVYSYVPYRNQDNLPVFDTALPDLNLTELYRTNRYVGDDRIGDANQLSLGVTTRLFDHVTGQQYLSATLGQTRYFTQPLVTLPGQTPISYGASNIIGQVAVSAYKNWSVKLDYQFNPYIRQTEKSEVAVQYHPDAERMVNLGYRFQHGILDQWDGAFAWPIAKHWNAVGRLVYSIQDGRAIEHIAGLEYRSCCWRIQVVQRRYVTNRNGALDSSIAIQLELIGLSSVGKPAGSFLLRSIGGYSAGEPTP